MGCDQLRMETVLTRSLARDFRPGAAHDEVLTEKKDGKKDENEALTDGCVEFI